MAEALKIVQGCVELTEDQRLGIEKSNQWVSDAMAILGQTYLEYKEAQTLFERLQDKLHSCELAAREAEAQRAKVVGSIAQMLELRDGEWSYDGDGKMVRKND